MVVGRKKKGRVLVIDDERLHREMLKDALSEGGFEVSVAMDGEEGTSLYKKTLPDIIITDLIMPNKGGVSTGVEISELAKKAGAEPVIILFSSILKERVREYESPELGACIHISKMLNPVDVTILIEQLHERNLRKKRRPEDADVYK